MKLLFKQRMFSWFDSYDIYDEDGNTVYTVEGKLSWGHCLHILNAYGEHIGTVQQRVLTFMPKFELYEHDVLVGTLRKEFTEWDYIITDHGSREVAVITKELFHWTDTYVIDVADPADALQALMVVLSIDAEKCSRN